MGDIIESNSKDASLEIVRPSKIEKIVTLKDYKEAKKVVEEYKSQLRQEIEGEQKTCEHESFYRCEYDDDHYIDVCRKCFHEWTEKNMPYLLEDYYKLTSGQFQKTEQDIENQKKYIARIEAINKL